MYESDAYRDGYREPDPYWRGDATTVKLSTMLPDTIAVCVCSGDRDAHGVRDADSNCNGYGYDNRNADRNEYRDAHGDTDLK